MKNNTIKKGTLKNKVIYDILHAINGFTSATFNKIKELSSSKDQTQAQDTSAIRHPVLIDLSTSNVVNLPDPESTFVGVADRSAINQEQRATSKAQDSLLNTLSFIATPLLAIINVCKALIKGVAKLFTKEPKLPATGDAQTQISHL